VYASASAGAREKDSSTLVEVHTRRGGEIDKHPSLCFSVFASLSFQGSLGAFVNHAEAAGGGVEAHLLPCGGGMFLSLVY